MQLGKPKTTSMGAHKSLLAGALRPLGSRSADGPRDLWLRTRRRSGHTQDTIQKVHRGHRPAERDRLHRCEARDRSVEVSRHMRGQLRRRDRRDATQSSVQIRSSAVALIRALRTRMRGWGLEEGADDTSSEPR